MADHSDKGKRRPIYFCCCLLFLLVFTAGTGADDVERRGAFHYRLEAERWVRAEAIFRSDSRWLGGDGASSVDLGEGRVLWLFGDSLIDLSGSGDRHDSVMVRNTIAVQTGYDPTMASMEFVWRMAAERPAAFFSKNGDTWYWPASGIMLGRNLLIFLMEIRKADNDLGFEACGWKAAWIDNPRESPHRWNLTRLVSPQQRGLVVGSGNPILENEYLQVFAADDRDLAVYLVRWSEADARAGILTRPQWWGGEVSGWVDAGKGEVSLQPVFYNGQMEFTVAYHSRRRSYFRVQTSSFLNPCLAVAVAPAAAGPWSSPVCFFSPPGQGDPELLIYAGKFHPMLAGADMIFSYVVNTISAERLFSDMDLYFPVLLKGRLKDNAHETGQGE